MEEEANRPVKKFQAGGISAALWKNTRQLQDGSEIETLSVTLDRRYRDKDDNWQSSASLGMNDVPKAMLVLGKAFDYMAGKKTDDINEIVEEEVVL